MSQTIQTTPQIKVKKMKVKKVEKEVEKVEEEAVAVAEEEAEKPKTMEEQMAEMMAKMARMEMDARAAAAENEELKAQAAKPKSKKVSVPPSEVLRKFLEGQEAKIEEATLKIEEVREVMNGTEPEMKEWILAQGIKTGERGERTQIDRDGTLDQLEDGMRFGAFGKAKGVKGGEIFNVNVIYRAATRDFEDADNGKTYPKLQDANKVWCAMRGTSLGNAWEDFKAIDRNGKKKSIEHIHLLEHNWLKDMDRDLWIY